MDDLRKQVDRGLQGLRNEYPNTAFQVSNRKPSTNSDMKWFRAHPGIRERDREYIPGEFNGQQIPKGLDLANIDRVHVMLLNINGVISVARIPVERKQ
jgi:hypothetical protein